MNIFIFIRDRVRDYGTMVVKKYIALLVIFAVMTVTAIVLSPDESVENQITQFPVDESAVVTSDVYDELRSLSIDQVVAKITPRINANPGSVFTEHVAWVYSVYYYGNGKALISLNESSRTERPRYSLYAYDNGTVTLYQKDYFKNLMDGSPEIIPHPENAKRVSIGYGYGDVCSSYWEVLHIDLSTTPFTKTISSQSHPCTNFEQISFTDAAGTEYEIVPILDRVCTNETPSLPTAYRGIEIVGTQLASRAVIAEPILSTCTPPDEWENHYLFSVNYSDVYQNVAGDFMFDVIAYQNGTTSKIASVEFSFEKGVSIK